jgi:hypothetical protein
MLQTLKNAWRIDELKKKLIFTAKKRMTNRPIRTKRPMPTSSPSM